MVLWDPYTVRYINFSLVPCLKIKVSASACYLFNCLKNTDGGFVAHYLRFVVCLSSLIRIIWCLCLCCSDASFGYPGGPILFKNLNFGIDLDSRIASKDLVFCMLYILFSEYFYIVSCAYTMQRFYYSTYLSQHYYKAVNLFFD